MSKDSVQSQHRVEAGVLLKDFEAAGFDCLALGKHPMFQAAMSEYGACKMPFDALMDVAEKLAIFNPALKSDRSA